MTVDDRGSLCSELEEAGPRLVERESVATKVPAKRRLRSSSAKLSSASKRHGRLVLGERVLRLVECESVAAKYQ